MGLDDNFCNTGNDKHEFRVCFFRRISGSFNLRYDECFDLLLILPTKMGVRRSNKISEQDRTIAIFDTAVSDVVCNISREDGNQYTGHFRGININKVLLSLLWTSKNIYRMNILVRLPDFTIRDVIKCNKKIYIIAKLGKKVTGRNLQTWKTQEFRYPKEFEILKKHEIRVCKVRPEIEVLHPETFQSETLKNKPRKELKINEKIKVVIDRGLWICHPL